MEDLTLPAEYTVNFGDCELSQDLADTLSDLLVKACGKMQDGYTEVAAWSDLKPLRNDGQDTRHDIYRKFLGFTASAKNAQYGYKVEPVFVKTDESADSYTAYYVPKLILRADLPSGVDDDCVITHDAELDLLADLNDELAQQHIYLLRVLVGESSLLD